MFIQFASERSVLPLLPPVLTLGRGQDVDLLGGKNFQILFGKQSLSCQRELRPSLVIPQSQNSDSTLISNLIVVLSTCVSFATF